MKLCQYPVTYHPEQFLIPIHEMETLSLSFFWFICDCCVFVQANEVKIRSNCPFSWRKERFPVGELWQCGDMVSYWNILVFDAYGIMVWLIVMLQILMIVWQHNLRASFPVCYGYFIHCAIIYYVGLDCNSIFS